MILIGFAAGFQSGLLGVGGGVIMVPSMVLLLGLSQHRAHGTSLAIMPLLVGLGLVHYTRMGNVDWTVAIVLAFGGVLGATIGARLSHRLSGTHLRKVFSVFMMAIGAKMALDVAPVVFGGSGTAAATHAASAIGGIVLMLTAAVGLTAGTLSGLLGVGGGFVMIPAMVLILGLPQKLAQGISLAVIIPVALSGTLIHYSKGNVDLKVALWIGVGGMLGAHYGAQLANNLNGELLRLIFSLFLLVISVLMFARRDGKESKEAAVR